MNAIQRDISPQFRQRVPTIELITPPPGAPYYALIRAEYVEDGASRFGPDHHALVDVWDEQGNREFGTQVNFTFPDDVRTVPVHKKGVPYGADLPLHNHGHVVGCWVGYFRERSDYVQGMGLGKIGSEQFNEHVDYFLVFQRQPGAIVPPVEPPDDDMTPEQHIVEAIRHQEEANRHLAEVMRHIEALRGLL